MYADTGASRANEQSVSESGDVDSTYQFNKQTQNDKFSKEIFDSMKYHYEQRITQLSDVIQDTCISICSDELLASMKLDATSSAFVPAHISEILNLHIDAERERYIHTVVENVSTLEAANRSMTSMLDKQSKKITVLESENHVGKQAEAHAAAIEEKTQGLQDQYSELAEKRTVESAELHSKINILEREKDALVLENGHFQRELSSRGDEVARLSRLAEQRTGDVRHLESRLEQTMRDLTIIQSVDAQEQQIKQDLKVQLQHIAEERDNLIVEMGDVQSKLRYTESEVGRLHRLEQEQGVQLHESRNKQQQLMAQVEEMLQTEANESNVAMAAVHEKMKELRHKMFTEVTKEQRHSAALAEELTLLRAFKEEKTRELRSAIDEEQSMREKLQRELVKVADLSRLHSEQTLVCREARMAATEADVKAREAFDKTLMLERKLADTELRHKEELLLAEESSRARSTKIHDLDNLELRTQAYRLHYQNQNIQSREAMGAGTTSPMRHSYSGLPNHSNECGMGLEAALASAKEVWSTEKAQLEQNMTQYLMKTEKLQSELDMLRRKMQLQAASNEEVLSTTVRTHQRETNAAATQHEHELVLAKSRLAEADRNLEKLKGMVVDKKKTIDWLQQEISRTKASLQGELESEEDMRRNGSMGHTTEDAINLRFKAMQDELENAQLSDKESERECVKLNGQIVELREQLLGHQTHNKTLELKLKQSSRKAEDAVPHEIQEHAVQRLHGVGETAETEELKSKLQEHKAECASLNARHRKARAGMTTLQQYLKDTHNKYNKVANSEGDPGQYRVNMNTIIGKFDDIVANHADVNATSDHSSVIQQLEIALAASLDETNTVREAALKDHEKDSAMLIAMQSKFDGLMVKYGPGADVDVDEKDNEIARLREQLAAAASTNASIIQRGKSTSDDASISSQGSASQSSLGTQGSAARRAISYKDEQLTELRQELSVTHHSLAEYKAKMVTLAAQVDAAKSSQRALKSSADALGDASGTKEELHRREIEHDRAVHLLKREVQSLTEKLQKGQCVTLNTFTPDRTNSHERRFSPCAEVGESLTWENHTSPKTGKKNRPASSLVYESVTKALLDALIRAHMLTPELAIEINNIAQYSENRSASTCMKVQQMLEEALERYKAEYQSALAGTIAESEQLHSRVNDLQAQLAKNQNKLNTSHFDEALSLDADSSRGCGVSQVDLEQSRHEHNLLVELTKLEGDARTKMLLSQLKDLRKRHSVELERVSSDKHEELTLQKAESDTQLAALNEEVRSLKQTIAFQADSLSEASLTRTSTLDTKLQVEKNRRKELVRQFEQIEEQHRVAIEELESGNLTLQQRCEKGELQITKLRMDLVTAGKAPPPQQS